jgi:hypothetical protein
MGARIVLESSSCFCSCETGWEPYSIPKLSLFYSDAFAGDAKQQQGLVHQFTAATAAILGGVLGSGWFGDHDVARGTVLSDLSRSLTARSAAAPTNSKNQDVLWCACLVQRVTLLAW